MSANTRPTESIAGYEHPYLTTDVIALSIGQDDEGNYRKLPKRRLEVLLVQRANEPYAGMWSLPGGFVNPGQTAREAALLKLREKTGLDDVYIEQLFTFTSPGRDPRGWVVSCAHMALMEKGRAAGHPLEPGARWFAATLRLARETCDHFEQGRVRRVLYSLSLTCEDADLDEPIVMETQVEHIITTSNGLFEERFDTVGPGGLAFDHAEQIAIAILRLRNKVEYTDLAFNLMPELFTLTELQNVYEAILGHELLKASFRRTVAAMVVETNEMASSAGHRPSRLFRRNWNLQAG